MDTDPSQESVREREEVRRQVKGIRAFYIHAAIYAVVMVMLILVNLMNGDALQGNWWVRWPALTWGVLLLIHGIIALRGTSLFGPDWEERKINEIMKRRGTGR